MADNGRRAEPTRAMLEKAVADVLRKADLGKAEPTVRRFSRNTLVELKRYNIFMRLYISDEVRCSVRINTPAHQARRDNFALYTPPEGTTEAQARRTLERDVELGRTLEAMAAASYSPDGEPAWVAAHLGPWLERWCEPKPQRRRLSISVSDEDYEALRRLAFCEGIRTPNKAAARILSEHLRTWSEDEETAGRLPSHDKPRSRQKRA